MLPRLRQTNKEKQAAYKARMRERGFVQITGWVHQEDKERVVKYINRLARRRSGTE